MMASSTKDLSFTAVVANLQACDLTEAVVFPAVSMPIVYRCGSVVLVLPPATPFLVPTLPSVLVSSDLIFFSPTLVPLFGRRCSKPEDKRSCNGISGPHGRCPARYLTKCQYVPPNPSSSSSQLVSDLPPFILFATHA